MIGNGRNRIAPKAIPAHFQERGFSFFTPGRFYYLQQACFGGRIASQTFGYGLTRPSKLNLLWIRAKVNVALQQEWYNLPRQ
jgi:hypothetical protein